MGRFGGSGFRCSFIALGLLSILSDLNADKDEGDHQRHGRDYLADEVNRFQRHSAASNSPAQNFARCGPRTRPPGVSPVHLPSSNVTTPFLIV